MSRKFWLPYTLAIMLLTLLMAEIFRPLAFTPSYAQGDCRTFPETGKQVCGRFLQYWLGAGGLAQQGLPISNEFTEVSDLNGKSYTVQYFERAEFEKHPENQAPYDVLLSQLGKFQFNRKYPNGEPGQSSPPVQPTPTTAASGPKLEVIDYQIVKNSTGDSGSVYGYIKNTGSVELGGIQIVGSFKDAAGKLVGTDSDNAAVLKSGEIWPFELYKGTNFTTVDLQLTSRPATQSDKRFSYRDYQVNDSNIVPPGDYSHAKVVGTVKNIGSLTGNLIEVLVLVTDNDGKTLTVEYTFTEIDELPPGATSPFEISLGIDDVPKYQVFVESFTK